VYRTGLPHLKSKTRVMMGSRPVEVARKTATKSTERIAPSTVQLVTFLLPWLRFIRDFSSVVRRMPGYNIWCKDGARPAFLLSQGGFTKCLPSVACLHQRLCHSGFKSHKAFEPKYAPPPSPPKSVVNKFRPIMPDRGPKTRRKPVSVSTIRIVSTESVSEPNDAVKRRNG
jgi:hypothetical protein